MNRIDEKFRDLREKGEKALIPFFTAGFPSAGQTVEMAMMAEKAGADLIELGIPFSDPIADGPVIQHTSLKAIEAGINTGKIFDICGQLKSAMKIPYLLMTYYNPVYSYGLKKFAKRCEETGVSGVILPDVPWEESGEIRETLGERDLRLIDFVTPFTSRKRAEKILSGAGGFVYFVTTAGVTGPRGSFSKDLVGSLDLCRKVTGTPIAAGFGISGASQIKMIKDHVDGTIIGSFFARKIIEGKTESIWEIMRRFKRALR